MEQRQLLGAGLRVPALSFGTATFGGGNDFFRAWGATDAKEARRLVDLCFDHGVNFFDTANGYSGGMAEEILGEALKGRRQQALIATKATFPMGEGPMEYGSSRHHIIEACEASLRRLGTDHIDLYFMHGQDMHTPVEETLRALDDLTRAGKIRYLGCSNFSGWHLMKSLAHSERHGLGRYVVNQTYYSLVGREYEWELQPLGVDQKVSAMAWSPLAGGALSGKITRTQGPAAGTRSAQMDFVVSSKSAHLHNVVDVLHAIARERNKTVPQVALNWVLQRPTVANVVIGARTEAQLLENFGAVGWNLTATEVARLDKVSAVKPIYPYWHQRIFPQLGH